MRRYEQVCILRPSLSEEEITRIIDTAAQLIQEDEGSVIFLNKWGMRKLAYPIKKESQGYYVLCDFAASPAVVAEIERKFRIDDAVLKYLTVKISDAISGEEIETARSEAEARAIVPESEEEPAAAAEEKPQESSSKAEVAQEAEAAEAPTEKDTAEASPEPESDAQQPEEPVQ
jgi:small subunit ribosomal protein S6